MESRKEIDASYKILKRVSSEHFGISKTLYFGGTDHRTHAHENARFVLVTEGCFFESYAGKQRRCASHTLIFRPPGEEHSEQFSADRSACFSIEIKNGPFADRVLPEHSVHFQSPLLFKIAKLLDQELLLKDPLSEFAIDFLLAELLAEVGRFESREQHLTGWLKTAVEYLQSEYLQPVSLSKLALQVGVHPVHLARVFRNIYGCTMADFIRTLRIQHALKELHKPERSLSEIALECGFADQSHFTRCFKHVTGKTPGQYRAGAY